MWTTNSILVVGPKPKATAGSEWSQVALLAAAINEVTIRKTDLELVEDTGARAVEGSKSPTESGRVCNSNLERPFLVRTLVRVMGAQSVCRQTAGLQFELLRYLVFFPVGVFYSNNCSQPQDGVILVPLLFPHLSPPLVSLLVLVSLSLGDSDLVTACLAACLWLDLSARMVSNWLLVQFNTAGVGHCLGWMLVLFFGDPQLWFSVFLFVCVNFWQSPRAPS